MKEPEEAAITCPVCGSDNGRRQRFSKRWFGWAMVLFGVPLAVRGQSYFCFACSKDFTIPRRDEIDAGDRG